MRTKEIEKEMEYALEDELGIQMWNGYSHLQEEKGESDLTRAISSMYQGSYNGFRDGERIVVTVNEPYEREIVEGSDGEPDVYGTDVFGSWLIRDVPCDKNIYHLTLIGDNEDLDDVVG